MTNAAGRSYWKNGNLYGEIAAPAYVSGVHNNDRQGSVVFKVSIVDVSTGEQPALNVLAGAAGTYTVKASISNQGKMSLIETVDLGTAGNANDPTDDTGLSDNSALGVATQTANLELMEITIDGSGAVEYKLWTNADGTVTKDNSATAWPAAVGTTATAVNCAAIYFGLQTKELTAAEETNTLATGYASTISPTVYKGASELSNS